METPLGLSMGEFRKLTADLPDNAEIYIYDVGRNVASMITQAYTSKFTGHQFFGVLLAPSATTKPTSHDPTPNNPEH